MGKRVRDLREEQGLTITDLANRAGLTRNAVSRIELGRRTPGSTTVEKLARGLGVEPGDLYTQEEQPTLPLEETPPRPLSEVAGEPETGGPRALRMVEAMLVRVSKAAGDKLEKWGRGAAASAEAPREAADVLQELLTAPVLKEAAEHGELPVRSQKQYEGALFRLETLRGHVVEGSPEEEEVFPPGTSAAERRMLELAATEWTELASQVRDFEDLTPAERLRVFEASWDLFKKLADAFDLGFGGAADALTHIYIGVRYMLAFYELQHERGSEEGTVIDIEEYRRRVREVA